MNTHSSIRLIGALGLALSGCGDDADPAAPLVSAEVLDFGQTSCGEAQVPRSVLLANPSSVAFSFTTSFATGTHYMVQPAAGFVLPGEQVELTVFSAKIPQGSPVTPNHYADTLTITTDLEGDSPHTIAIEQTARGAILEVSAPSVTIPGVQVIGSTATASLTIKNVGNEPVSNVAVTAEGAFTFTPNAIDTIAPGEEVTGTVTYRAMDAGTESAPISITADGAALCGTVPAPVVATGTGTFAGAVPTKIVLVPGGRYRGSTATLFAILPGGLVASLGSNERGVRGAGSLLTLDQTPSLVRTADDRALDGVVDVVGSRGGACALRSNGSVYCWGNDSMKRARDQGQAQPYAQQVVASGATAIAMNYGVRCIAKNPGSAVSCIAADTPAIPSTWKPTDVASFSLHTSGGYALKTDGTVVSFGSNENGERGNNSASNSAPSEVTGLTDVKQTIAHSGKPNNGDKRGGCALKTDGTVWCWGAGRHGRIGNGSTGSTSTPAQVMIDASTPLTNVTQISGSHGHRCAVTPDNVYCWGNGRNYKLGRPSAPDDNAYAQPTDQAITGGIGIATTQRGTCVLRTTGQIVCFGQTPLSYDEPVAFDDFVAAP